jgi:hypothetical protein
MHESSKDRAFTVPATSHVLGAYLGCVPLVADDLHEHAC